MKKLTSDEDKKRKREEVSAQRAGEIAQCREQHQPSAQPGRPTQPAAAPSQAAKQDQRTFNNRAVQRKEGRVTKEDRRVEVVRDGGRGKGGGKDGGGKSGGKPGGN